MAVFQCFPPFLSSASPTGQKTVFWLGPLRFNTASEIIYVSRAASILGKVKQNGKGETGGTEGGGEEE